MTVKELINELLECDLDTEVTLKISLEDMDLEYDDFEVDVIKTGTGWGKNTPYLTVHLENRTSENFIDED